MLDSTPLPTHCQQLSNMMRLPSVESQRSVLDDLRAATEAATALLNSSFEATSLEDGDDEALVISSSPADTSPVPRRGKLGNDILGPQNPERAKQARDTVRPPLTDHGKMSNMKWSFTDSHIRLEEGGWTRETTIRELPTSKELAGVNMRLGKGVYRELHWHNESEWAYIIAVS